MNPLGKGNKTLLDIAEQIQTDDALYNAMLEKSENGGFIKRMRVLMDHFGDDLLKVLSDHFL